MSFTSDSLILPTFSSNLTKTLFQPLLASYRFLNLSFLWNFPFNTPFLQCHSASPFSKKYSAHSLVSHPLPAELKSLAKFTFLRRTMPRWSLWDKWLLMMVRTPRTIHMDFSAGCMSLHFRPFTVCTSLFFTPFKILDSFESLLHLYVIPSQGYSPYTSGEVMFAGYYIWVT